MTEPSSPVAAAPAPLVVGLGELIWDLLPTGRQLGGAPANFAYISHLLGNRAVVASRVGADALGGEARARLTRLGLLTRYLQTDAHHPTGTVGVEIGAHGEPHFAVNQNSAWDLLAWTPDWAALADAADVVGFGTLGQRDPQARATLLRFLARTRPTTLRVFDVNLRHSFFTADMLARSLALATIVKLNCAELTMAASMLQLPADLTEERAALRLLELFDIELVAVTRGAHGSLLVTRTRTDAHPGWPVRVVDTIGAGDAFTAALAHYYLRGAPLDIISAAANRLGAWVAAQAGATPAADPQTVRRLLPDWPKEPA